MTNKYLRKHKETLREILEKHDHPINVNQTHQATLNWSMRLAAWITSHVSTMSFFWLCFILVTIPLIWKSSMPTVQYISSGYLQLILLPILGIGQAMQTRHAELMAQSDYAVNLKAEALMETLITEMEEQKEEITYLKEMLEKSLELEEGISDRIEIVR